MKFTQNGISQIEHSFKRLSVRFMSGFYGTDLTRLSRMLSEELQAVKSEWAKENIVKDSAPTNLSADEYFAKRIKE
jgi:hypothetical protein